MKQVRETSENVLLLDGGNTLFGNRPLAQQTQGQAIVEGMNLLGYDAMVLGSEDFRLGLDVLRQRMAEAKFPILSANVVLRETEQLFATPYVIKEMGDHRVAIIGLTSQAAASTAGDAIAVLDPLESLGNVMDEVNEKADVIIVLSHLGAEANIQLAKAAMYAGAKIMMRALGVDKLDKVILAGAFGSYIDKESAALLGQVE